MAMPHILVFVLVLQLARHSGASYGNCSCFESQDNITFDNGTSIAYVLVLSVFCFSPPALLLSHQLTPYERAAHVSSGQRERPLR